LLGAEFTRVSALRRGARVEPSANAVPVMPATEGSRPALPPPAPAPAQSR